MPNLTTRKIPKADESVTDFHHVFAIKNNDYRRAEFTITSILPVLFRNVGLLADSRCPGRLK
jgi:hypothetical protein